MPDLTFLAKIPEAQDLVQDEYSSTEVQKAIYGVISLICQDIAERRSELNRGKTIETISIGVAWRGESWVCNKEGSYIRDKGYKRIRVNEIILDSAVRCFQLKGYKVRLSRDKSRWWNPFRDCAPDCPESPVHRRRMYVSVQKKNAIAGVDDLTLMKTVDYIFDEALDAAGSQH